MAEADDILTIVDSPDQADNVSRMAQKANWGVQVNGKEEGIYVRVTRKSEAQEPELSPDVLVCSTEPVGGRGPLVLVVPGEYMGRGDNEELGTVLIRAFFHTLIEVEPKPATIIFFNSGVKWTVEGSEVVPDLQELATQGIEILVCGTCLGYYELKDKLAVGTVSNMYTIAETMLGAGQIVSL